MMIGFAESLIGQYLVLSMIENHLQGLWRRVMMIRAILIRQLRRPRLQPLIILQLSAVCGEQYLSLKHMHVV